MKAFPSQTQVPLAGPMARVTCQVFMVKLHQNHHGTCPTCWPFWDMFKGSLGGETSVLRTFRMSGKEFVKERVSEGKS